MYDTLYAVSHCTLFAATSARAQFAHRKTLRTGLQALAKTARKVPMMNRASSSPTPASRAALACA
eukprot:9833360-Alexandrium_andersonii.AAC.1